MAGGGALNDYGRDEAGSTISRGGDGRFLHGAWDPPDSLALHGDFRFATADSYVADRNHVLIFPMQSDIAAMGGPEGELSPRKSVRRPDGETHSSAGMVL